MQTFSPQQSHIHIITRVILLQGDGIVLCRVKGHERFFLPGGHVEDGELAEEALKRELKEELGIAECENIAFAGVCEGAFPRDREHEIFQHEVCLVFEAHIPEGEIVSREDHIEFICVDREHLNEYALMPTPMRSGIMEWFTTRKPFFRSFQD